MRGIVFVTLNELVEETWGLGTWQTLLDQVKPQSNGIYTAAETYDDAEIFSLATALAELTGWSLPELLRPFGQRLFQVLAGNYPGFLEGHETSQSFLKSVHHVVHIEVLKLYPNAHLPIFNHQDMSPDHMVLKYQSPRKLCYLAEGLIQGVAHYFNQTVLLQQSACMHQGSSYCCFDLLFQTAQLEETSR